MQPVPMIHTEDALEWSSLLLACQEKLLSREFIGLIKMKVLKMGIWLTNLSSPSGYLSKKINAWVIFHNIVCNKEVVFPSAQEAVEADKL